jgi:succinylglutamate desuccinylase
MQREIGRYEGKKSGPLLICVGGIHGNERVGVLATKTVISMLQNEELIDPTFIYSGHYVALTGNLSAINQGVRFLDQDLNRCWLEENFDLQINNSQKASEINEMHELYHKIEEVIREYNFPKTFLLDLHTTSSPKGIFAVTTNDKESTSIAKGLHCPVLLNLTESLKGSMVQYFVDHDVLGQHITALAFEAGRHDDPLSISRGIAAIINAMRAIDSVPEHSVESRHDRVLQAYAHGLPQWIEVIYKHKIEDATKFVMLPGFEGYQAIRKGELLAHYDGVEVLSPMDGLILMPLYQQQGNEGFFIVREVVG